MEEILIRMLEMRRSKLAECLERAKTDYESGKMVLSTASSTVAQLKQLLYRLQEQMRHYTSSSTNPQINIVTEAMELQLQGEDFLTDIESSMEAIEASSRSVPTEQYTSHQLSIRLPKLEMTKFNGEGLKWFEFWDRFSSNIDSQPMAEADKLTYLISSLEGKALEAVAGLAITNHNYTIAIEALKSRYGSNDTLVDAHYTALTNLERAEYTAPSCRGILDGIERHLRVLEKLGEDINGNHLRATILSKFPEQVLHQYHLMPQLHSKDNSTTNVRQILLDIVVALEKAQISPIPKGPATQQEVITTEVLQTKSELKREYPKGRTASSKPERINMKRKANNQLSNPPRKCSRLPCIFCKLNNHSSADCKKYNNIEARQKQLGDRCHKCLKRNHKTEQCHRKVSCFRCGEGHLQMLCSKPRGEAIVSNGDHAIVKCYMIKNFTFLQTAVALVTNPGNTTKRHKCRLVLDSGSQRSYISAKAASRLQLTPDNEDQLLVYTFGATHPKEMSSPSVDIVLETKRGIQKQVRVNIVPHITERLPVAKFDCSTVDLVADDDSTGDNVDLLIGNDYFAGFMRETKEKIQNDLYLVDSDFGWLLSGNVDQDPTAKKENVLTVTTYCHCHNSSCPYFTEPDLPLRNIDIKFLWSLECIGINDSPKATRQDEAVKHFNDTVQYKNGRYEVTWPWIEYPPQLPVNFGMALGRLKSLINRLDKTTLQEYDDILKEQLSGNIIEIVEPHYNSTEHPVHYLAHHIVKTEGKRGRIVYDASARATGKKSLNECLYSGPSMLEDLTALLLKFRTKKIAIVADVEKAFLQVGLQEKDRDVTRFLWVKDITKDPTEENLLYLRFRRVPFGIIASPFLLAATIRYHMTQTDITLLKDVANNCYVDNLVTGANSIQEAQEIYEKTKESFEQISMNIRDWLSNEKEFLDLVPTEKQAKHEGTVKILGLTWNVARDTLKLKITDQHFNKDTPANTKRKVLRTLARIYDPCGFICPLTLPVKILFRHICEQKHKWDTVLPTDLIQSMQEVLDVIETAAHIELPRCITNAVPEFETTYQLNCFSDASKAGYAAVIYLTSRSQQGTSVSFLMGKSRIAKNEDSSELHIPKLELLGLLIASRLLKYVRENLSLPISKETLWTDSLVVHGWMRSNKLLPPFVSNRVEEIKKNQMQAEIYYINTKMNPADVATRPDRWSQSKELWFNGPTFLKEDESVWPADRYYMNHMTVLSVGEGLDQSNYRKTPEVDNGPGNQLIDNNQQMEIDDVNDDPVNENWNGDIMEIEPVQQSLLPSKSADTIEKIKELQKHHFADEIAGKRTHLTRNLGLFLDVDGILRCQGRMVNTTWNYDMKHPILLPRDSEFTNMIIKDTHEGNYHVGATHTLSLIRERYWIPQGKRRVERVISRCQQCIKHGGGPYRLPAVPDLPNETVNYSTPYTYCGVDYFGPLYVNTPNGKQKRWVALFTCLAVRAIHLEIVNDLTAEECLLALRRFAATRNTPKRMYSDNATCFKLTSEVVSKPYCIERGIEWRFIPQLAPWHGGYYERLIGVVKHSLKRTLEKHLLGDSKLLTVLKEVEAVVNSRPLTKVGTEVIHILRPADFLSLGKCLTLTPATSNVYPVDGSKLKTNLIESWKRGLTILEEFKKIFMSQYLTSLRERYQNSPKQPRVVSDCVPKIGDIVQVRSDLKNRELWKVGKIADLIKGADGKHRVAKVKFGDSILTRSVGHLYPLETEPDNSAQSGPAEEEVTAPLLDAPIEYLNLDDGPSRVDNMQPPLPTNPEFENNDNEVDTTSEVMPVQESMMNTETSRSEVITSDPDCMQSGTRGRRDAAIQARKKILEWTRHLLTLLQ